MSKPFSGLTFCCTGLDTGETGERADMYQIIATLGGTCYTDLMSLVNFLVVGKRRTEKYRFCVRARHDMVFVAPSTVQEIYARWKSGDTIVPSDLRPLAVFSNFTVCVARVEQPDEEERRRYLGHKFRSPPAHARPATLPQDVFRADDLMSTMVKGGAVVSLILTPACSVLVGLDCLGKRYAMAREWGIPVVHPVWVLDLCLRGAALEPADYKLTPDKNYYPSDFPWEKFYAARADKAEILPNRERLALKKSSHVWASIMDTKEVHDSTWEPEPDDHDSRDPTTPALFSGLVFYPLGLSSAQQSVLQKVLESHLGTVSRDPNERVLHIVLLVRNAPEIPSMLQQLPASLRRRVNNGVHIVTDWFIERCVYYNEIRYDSWGKLLNGVVPLPLRLRVCVTGFTGVELLHIEKLISLLNFECCSVLSAKRDLLVVNINLFKSSFSKNSPLLFEYKHKDILACPVSSSGHESKTIATVSAKNKINAAKKWNIPIVSLAYLWEMIETLQDLPNLNIPEISDRQWCIFAPQKSSPARPGKESRPPKEEGLVQLPSPRKSKEKHKYGRLVGGGESLTEKLNLTRTDTDTSRHSPELLDNDSTQVGYGNAESMRGNKDLMDKLEDVDRPRKRSRRNKDS